VGDGCIGVFEQIACGARDAAAKGTKVKPDVQTRNIGVLDAPDARDIIRAALTTAMRMWEISRLPTDQSAQGCSVL
jgi:hypothetical protein